MGWGRRVLAGASACAGVFWMTASAAGATRPATVEAAPLPAAATTVSVIITDTGFEPPSLSVPVGTVVIWTNQGTSPHTVTAVDGAFASDDLTPGATFPYQFTQVGQFQYRDVHAGDVGTVTVVSGALEGVTSPGAAASTPGAAPGAPAANPAGGPTMAFTGSADWILGGLGGALLVLGLALLRRAPAFAVPFRVDRQTAITIERGRRQRTDLLPDRRRRFRRR